MDLALMGQALEAITETNGPGPSAPLGTDGPVLMGPPWSPMGPALMDPWALMGKAARPLLGNLGRALMGMILVGSLARSA